ncbi:sporulation stage II protein D [Clostridium putrefaciens]|uniref:Sporulation stage II protein D n=1 Tax=Clostridium putrefaciens TaxID=99675 RepID=A0A381J7K8_9CLOT|nr:stage II sporulation protein D [Clostridium putrefaciens]SUY46678.1 sporulation stage II protein D [Clostridium putrefaciens]
MYKTVNNFDLKRIIIGFMLFMLFIVLLPLMIIGFKDKDVKEIKKYEVSEKNDYRKNELEGKDLKNIKVYNKNKNKISEINLEEYIIGVVASEMPASFNEEALKAQAVAARTFAVSKMLFSCKEAKGGHICDTVHCQVYVGKDERIKGWGKEKGEEYWNKIKKAVEETNGEILTYEGNLVLNPQYFAVSSGKTENADDVFTFSKDYLKSVESPGEDIAPKYKSKEIFSYKEFIIKVNENYKEAHLNNENLLKQIEILERTEGGAVRTVRLGEQILTGVEFRKLFNLNSANFNMNFEKGKIEIQCIGYGHGVGMSQWGANVMGKDNKTYKEILSHYYKGIEIEFVNK